MAHAMISLTLLVSTELGAARAPTEASASRMVLENCILMMIEAVCSQDMVVTGFEQRDVGKSTGAHNAL